ncbi:hypothetical protein L9F63_026055, partial [Diploptera punctata]
RNFSDYFTDLKRAVIELKLYSTTDPDELTEHIENITSFINSDVFSSFQEIDPWRIRVNTQEKNFTTKTVKELETKYPIVQWKILFGALFNSTALDSNTKVQVYFENYFDKIFDHLNKSLSDQIGRVIVHNGLLAMLAHDIYMDLIKPRPCDREDYCLKIASKLMKYASSSLYLSSFTEQELDDMENELDTLFKELKDVLKEQINITSWLDEESRNIMLDKLSNMTIMVPSSRSILLNSKFLNSYFLNNLNFTTHFDNAIELLRQGRNHLYSHVGINTSEPEAMLFFSLPSDIHPISVYELNTVCKYS